MSPWYIHVFCASKETRVSNCSWEEHLVVGYTGRHYCSVSEPALYQDIWEVETTIVNRYRGAFLTDSDLPDIPKHTYHYPTILSCSLIPLWVSCKVLRYFLSFLITFFFPSQTSIVVGPLVSFKIFLSLSSLVPPVAYSIRLSKSGPVLIWNLGALVKL